MNFYSILFGIYLVMFPLFPSSINRVTLFTEFFMFGLIILYLILNMKDKDKRRTLKYNILIFFKDKVSLLLSALFLLMVISIIYSTSYVLALRDTMRFGIAICLFFLIRFEVRNEKMLNTLIKFIYIPAFFQFTYGIFQGITGFNLDFFTGDIPRIEGTLGHPNTLAGYAVVLFFPLFFIIIYEKNKRLKAFYFIELIFMVVNIVLTFSRNNWLALVLGLVLLCLYYKWKLIFPLILLGCTSLFSSTIRLRLSQFTDPNINSGRIKIWTLAFKCFKEHPIFGVGNGNYEAVHPKYVERFPELNPGEQIYHTHNVYLKMLSELGIIGFLLYISSSILLVIKTINIHKRLDGFYKNLVGGILISFTVSLFLMNLFDNIIILPQIMNYFFIFIGVIYAIEKIKIK